MSDEFEEALRRALRPKDPGEDFTGKVVSRLDAGERAPAPVSRLESRRLAAPHRWWVPLALAASVIAGVGLFQLRQHAVDAQRASQARAQLLQALSIASDNVNLVRAAVAREESPDS